MPTITKRDLAILTTHRLSENGYEFTQQHVAEIIQALIEGITASLSNGDSVVIRNFGSFEVREVRAKVGRNPRSPEHAVIIPAKAGVRFKPGKELKESVGATLPLIRERLPRRRKSA